MAKPVAGPNAHLSSVAPKIISVCRLLTTLSFIEEVLPFTDIVPSATIGWLMEYTRAGKRAQGKPEPSGYPTKFTSNTLHVLR